jgi:hypothetical protein
MQDIDYKRLKDKLVDAMVLLNTGRECNAHVLIQNVVDELKQCYEDNQHLQRKIDKLIKENERLKGL